ESADLQASISGKVKIVSPDLGFVRIRSVGSTDGQELGQIPDGTIIPFSDIVSGWYKIEYNNISGWVSGAYVKNE
ncbi:MAG: SH3 domain-containing protein, partial [Bacteroidales bacterium]|nr:SH3 domain-containing protein [Bacteroidales bacterium]